MGADAGQTTPAGKHLGNDADFVLHLPEEAGVAAVQGAAFGLEPYLRISTATSMEVIAAACTKIGEAVAGLA